MKLSRVGLAAVCAVALGVGATAALADNHRATPEPVSQPDPDTLNRNSFIVSAAVTALSVGTFVYGAQRVHDAEDRKNELVPAIVGANIDGIDELEFATNACTAVEPAAPAPGSADERNIAGLSDACDDGHRWATISNASLGVAVVGIAASAYFGYKWYADGQEKKQPRAVVTPAVSPDGAAVGLTVWY